MEQPNLIYVLGASIMRISCGQISYDFFTLHLIWNVSDELVSSRNHHVLKFNRKTVEKMVKSRYEEGVIGPSVIYV